MGILPSGSRPLRGTASPPARPAPEGLDQPLHLLGLALHPDVRLELPQGLVELHGGEVHLIHHAAGTGARGRSAPLSPPTGAEGSEQGGLEGGSPRPFRWASGGQCRSHPLTRKEGRAGEPAGGRGLWPWPRPQPDWAPEQRRWVCTGATTWWGCRGPGIHSQGPHALGRCSEHAWLAGQGGGGAPRDCLLTSVREGCLWGAGGSCYFLRPPLFSDLRRTMPGFPTDQQRLEVRGVGKGPAAGQGLGWTVVLGPVHGGANQLSLDGSSLVSKGRGRQPHDAGGSGGAAGGAAGPQAPLQGVGV